ncbi:MAG TPA: hypothetical protein VG826_11395 [Pirellulales bacterium]|nr:hypothetical protein [Pirellulales bacterium]
MATTLASEMTLHDPACTEAQLCESEIAEDDLSLMQLLDLLLKDRPALEQLLRRPGCQRRFVPRLLTLGLIGFAVYGVGATVMLNSVHEKWGFWPSGIPRAHWNDASIGNLLLAYCLGLVAVNGICLPSFYFYGLLAGVRTSVMGVVSHAMKGMASAAVALLGILPIYVATALAVVVFPFPRELVLAAVALGLALPFVAGIWGVRTLYDGFLTLRDTICHERRESRACLLRRLLLAWCALYTAVTPLMVYVLWNFLAAHT